ncbi:MAG: DUF4198 domain-containing protein [Synergistaceae bacterium]|jgi:hypothetical protein|nr:DUF4198 domain-containing protein [Synergistaceae bacterium]
MKFGSMSLKFKVFLCVMFLQVMAVIPAYAHNSLLYTDKSVAEVGETVDVIASISEPFGTPDFPFYFNERIDYTYGPLKMAAFKGDSVSDLDIAYCDIRDGTKKKYTDKEVEAAYLDQKGADPKGGDSYTWMGRVFNCDVGEYKIPSEGTVSFAAASSYGTDTVVKSFMKTFVNLTADGESTKARAPHFAFDGIEIRPVDDLASVKAGGKVRVEALLNGKPQSGVVVYSGYKDMPDGLRVSPVLEYSETLDPIYCAGVTDVNGVVELKLPEIPSGTEELKDAYLFTDGHLTVEKVRYRATISFNLKK